MYTCIMDIKFDDNVKIDRGSWLRLMGVTGEHQRRAETDQKMKNAIERLGEQMEVLLFDAAEPAFTYEVIDQQAVETGALPIRGVSLQKHLEGCSRMVLMAVTLGHAVDQLISETQSSRIALGVVVDCGASVMAELAANLAEEQIRAKVASEAADTPLFMTERFSPGYGDSPLEMQEQVLNLLDAEDRLGITLSKGYMMCPSKSITAIMGLSDHPVTGRLATCAECVLRDKCQLIKEGKRCGASRQ